MGESVHILLAVRLKTITDVSTKKFQAIILGMVLNRKPTRGYIL